MSLDSIAVWELVEQKTCLQTVDKPVNLNSILERLKKRLQVPVLHRISCL